jgi:hypothetical protein
MTRVVKIWSVLTYAAIGMNLGCAVWTAFVLVDAVATANWRWAAEFAVMITCNLGTAWFCWRLTQAIAG